MSDESPDSLGEIIRRQRELNELSMRQFAKMVGISNPYLSQIERGLRAPSERVLEAIARSLKLPADTLHAQANQADDEPSPAVDAIRADPHLTARQRRALLEVYDAFTSGGEARHERSAPRRASEDADAADANSR